MAEIKTRPTDASVDAFIASVENKTRRADAEATLEMFKRITGETPVMWGPGIVGFGVAPYKYPDGREIDWPIVGFSPRKQNLTLYVICSSPKQPALFAPASRATRSMGTSSEIEAPVECTRSLLVVIDFRKHGMDLGRYSWADRDLPWLGY